MCSPLAGSGIFGSQKLTILSWISSLLGISIRPDFALSPVADRFHPQARSPLVMRFEVLVDAEISLALDQAKPTWVCVGKRANLQIAGVCQRSPQWFVAPIVNAQSIGVVDRGPVVINVLATVGVEKKLAGRGRYSHVGDVYARIEHRRRRKSFRGQVES